MIDPFHLSQGLVLILIILDQDQNQDISAGKLPIKKKIKKWTEAHIDQNKDKATIAEIIKTHPDVMKDNPTIIGNKNVIIKVEVLHKDTKYQKNNTQNNPI